MLLPTLIDLRRPAGKALDPEDIFGSSLGGVFTDDLQNQHGTDANTRIVYSSTRYGSLEFLTADPNDEEQRRKFAHYLWNAGVLVGELVGGRPESECAEREENLGEGGWWVSEEEGKCWNVEGERVLELGAGALRWT